MMRDPIKSFLKIQIYYINILFTKRVHDISEKQERLLRGGVTFSESKLCCIYNYGYRNDMVLFLRSCAPVQEKQYTKSRLVCNL